MEKKFLTYKMEVNGLLQEVKFSEETIETVFMPFLHELTDLKMTMDRKVIAYLVAPPGAGKSTVAKLLERLSYERSNEVDTIRALGIDGYQFTNAYMNITNVERDGKQILMRDIKGAPETFDVDLLVDKIREARQEGTDWNVYDRKIHDVLPDYWSVEEDILLIEGNYLLLKEAGWTNVRVLSDYSVFIEAPQDILRERLINRKIEGGLSREDAERFYEFSDSKNIERVLKNSARADETWKLLPNGDFEKQCGIRNS
ncbi:MAG: nucleoside/nucleotide kinase family protein [Selenomonadaceae bacterium]|nr:nucleoside/nucleotide kinase family protein [Selenomonadaceae bacterium]